MSLVRKTPMARTSIRPQSIAAPQKPRVRKCAQCRQAFEPKPPGAKVCGGSCAALYAAAIRSKRERKEDRAKRASLKSRQDWLKDAQTAFNRFIRARDFGSVCCACGNFYAGVTHASHYMSVGARPNLRFDESNCHAGCQKCNVFLHGNLINYRINLIAKVGAAEVDRLENDMAIRKLTADQIKEIAVKYRLLSKEIELKNMEAV